MGDGKCRRFTEVGVMSVGAMGVSAGVGRGRVLGIVCTCNVLVYPPF